MGQATQTDSYVWLDLGLVTSTAAYATDHFSQYDLNIAIFDTIRYIVPSLAVIRKQHYSG